MRQEKPVTLMVTVPRVVRDKLRRIAAERNMKNLNSVTTATGIGREIICEYLQTHSDEEVRVT